MLSKDAWPGQLPGVRWAWLHGAHPMSEKSEGQERTMEPRQTRKGLDPQELSMSF